jgi:GNAT superfamily N-acetyltransferase
VTLTPEDAEAIERATLAALPPLVQEAADGWLLNANCGVISRANSVTPLRAGRDALADKIDRAIGFYARHGLPPAFRVSPFSQPRDLADALTARGFTPMMETLVMARVIEPADETDDRVEFIEAFDDGWRALFVDPGADAIQAAIRAETLARGDASAFARLRSDGETVAIGVVSVDGAWAGIHGMRTRADRRGEGLGGAVIQRLLDEAHRRGATRAYLQVEAVNAGAIRLYARRGFTEAYRYGYWRVPK